MTIPTMSCEAERNLSKSSVIKKIDEPGQRFSAENDISKPLSYEEAIKENTAKNDTKKVL